MQSPARPHLIVVEEGKPAYELPDDIPTGSRHDEITRYVGSLSNKGLTKAAVEASARADLFPLMSEVPDEAKFRHDFDDAWDGAAKKWGTPAAGTPQSTSVGAFETEDGVLIDPLAIASQIERPDPLDPHAMPLPAGLMLLMRHFTPITDAPWSSLMLASCVTMSALVGPNPRLRWRQSHRASLFGVLVGEHATSGRKTQTLNEVESAFRRSTTLLERSP